MKLLSTLIALFLVVQLQAQDFENVEIKTVEVAENIYMLEGRGGNIGVIIGEDGVMIVDNQFAPLADKIKAAIKKLSDQPVKYVVNTHWHGDHMGGNEEFSKDGSIVIAHENVRTRLTSDQFMAFQQRTVEARSEGFWPVITFSEDMTYYFNDEQIMIHHGPPAHTDGDAMIFFKKANVVHMGDAFVRYGYPFIDVSAGGSVTGMIENINQVLTAIDEETKIIPGHGAVSNKADMQNFLDVLTDITVQVQDAIEAGKSLDDILSMGITSDYDEDWDGAFIKANSFLTFVYEDLVGK